MIGMILVIIPAVQSIQCALESISPTLGPLEGGTNVTAVTTGVPENVDILTLTFGSYAVAPVASSAFDPEYTFLSPAGGVGITLTSLSGCNGSQQFQYYDNDEVIRMTRLEFSPSSISLLGGQYFCVYLDESLFVTTLSFASLRFSSPVHAVEGVVFEMNLFSTQQRQGGKEESAQELTPHLIPASSTILS